MVLNYTVRVCNWLTEKERDRAGQGGTVEVKEQEEDLIYTGCLKRLVSPKSYIQRNLFIHTVTTFSPFTMCNAYLQCIEETNITVQIRDLYSHHFQLRKNINNKSL